MSVIYGNPITMGGGGLELVANVADGATVTATLGSKTVTGVSVDGASVVGASVVGASVDGASVVVLSVSESFFLSLSSFLSFTFLVPTRIFAACALY